MNASDFRVVANPYGDFHVLHEPCGRVLLITQSVSIATLDWLVDIHHCEVNLRAVMRRTCECGLNDPPCQKSENGSGHLYGDGLPVERQVK